MRSLNPWSVFPPNLDPPIARSLSIQFILQEWLSTFDLLEHLKTHVCREVQGVDLKQELANFSKELQKLFLFSLGAPFAQKSSALDKLCFYFEILLQASHIHKSEIPALFEEMRISVLKLKPKMMSGRKQSHSPAEIREAVLALCKNFHEQLIRFFNAFIPFLKEGRSDENVLVYLIEHKETLNTFLGSRKIETVLQSFFPAGYAQLRATILEGYTRRGFTQFFAKVEPLIEALEPEFLCPTRNS